MNRFKKVFPAVLAMTCALVAPAFGEEEAVSVSSADNQTPSLWFIEFAGSPLASGGSKADLKAKRDAFAANANSAGAQFKQRFEFETLWNGISVSVTPENLAKIANLPGVVNVWPVDSYSVPEEPVANNPDLYAAIVTSGASAVQASGNQGEGMKIGIIDTGVDIDHPDFGGTGVQGTTPFPSAKVVAGWDFVGDLYDANPANPTYNPVPSPDPNPDDCGGHGSHVAGIATADGVVKGVAPKALLGAYRVFGCTGSTDSDIMIAAMERAYKDGMNVVNMSIGAAYMTWPQYPTAVAADNLMARDVVVVCSIGNSGVSSATNAGGLYSASAPGVSKDAIGVASLDNTALTFPYFTVSPDATKVGYGSATGAPPAPKSGTATLANANIDGTPLAPGALTGKVALVARGGGIGFHDKARNAQTAGAIGVVLYNNVAGRVSPTVVGATPITIPVVAITQADGLLISARITSDPATSITWVDGFASFANPTGGLSSDFSSYGLAADLSLKPDIAAPGGSIFSTYPVELGSYATISGTSMASPHVAGTAALLRKAHPKLKASEVRDILQNSALPRDFYLAPGFGYLEPVSHQGAGLVRIDRAIAATTRVTPGKLSVGESEAGPVSKTLTISNNSSSAVTYDLSSVRALGMGPARQLSNWWDSTPTVTFSEASVAVGPNKSKTVTVTFSGPFVGEDGEAMPNKSQFGGYVVITPQGGGASVSVPFAGVKGDYQSIQVLTPTANGFPWLAQRNAANTSYLNRTATGATYTMQGSDVPFFLVHLEHPSRTIKLSVFHADSGAPVHSVFNTGFEYEYNSPNSTLTGFFALAWDGTRVANNGKGNDNVWMVPNGNYILKLSVLKANGDASNAAHWEVFTTPVVTIARP